jgi:general secretion pathway protein E
MPVTDRIRALVVAGASLDEIRAAAKAQGMVPLRAAGWEKVCAGITTVEELLRVTRDESTA